MAVSNFVYNTFFKKSSSAALTVVVGAILFERGVDAFTDSVFEYYNRGVSCFAIFIFRLS